MFFFSSCSSAPTCGVKGGTNVCICTSGEYGAQVCRSDGSWGPCICTAGDSTGEDGRAKDVLSDVLVPGEAITKDLLLDSVDVEIIPFEDVFDVLDDSEIEIELVTDSDVPYDDSSDLAMQDSTNLDQWHDTALDQSEQDFTIGCDEDELCDPGEGLECPGCAAIAVAAGALHTCALRVDKSIWCWGDNMSGELGFETPDMMVFQPHLVEGMPAAKAISTSGAVFAGSTCSVAMDGGIWCWGKIGGQMFPASLLESIHAAEISTAQTHACALTEEGTVACWGQNQYGQIGNGEDGPFFIDPQPVSDLTTVTSISCGDSGDPEVNGPVDGGHCCALLEDKSMWCWGSGSNGQLGDGLSTSSNVPIVVTGLGPVASVAAGGESVGGDKGHTCAALVDGSVWCWGTGWGGQLGDGNEVASAIPVQVSGLTQAKAVAVGGIHSCALTNGGQIWCWGHNYHGQLGNGNQTNQETPVQVADINSAVAVSAGKYHTCAVLEGGSLRCWGNGDSGQLGQGTNSGSKIPVTPISF
jgi:alpha-tubulin suppressor-like RCC1 family protein